MKAVALISGGLDSILAVKLIRQQGIDVEGVYFKIPFLASGKYGNEGLNDFIKRLRLLLGIEIRIIDVGEEFLEIVNSPKYGYGKNVNPCIDCRIFMLREAKKIMREVKAEFMVTGEVLGQRGMSQYKSIMKTIEKEAGLEDLIVRPLTARTMPETIPEKRQWVKREELMDLQGRTRVPQMELAKKLGIKEYLNPAGGCLLTDPNFSRKVKDLLAHKSLDVSQVKLLKYGRHFRLSSRAKLIVGRDEAENERLLIMAEDADLLFMPTEDVAGPTGLGRGVFEDELMNLAAKIICYYCDPGDKINTQIICRRAFDEKNRTVCVSPVAKEEAEKLRI